MTDAVNEIKNSLKPSFCRPYIWVSVQKTLRLRGLYDTGADISCMSEKVFRQLPLNARPKKLNSDKPQKFKSAGGEPLPVRGLYELLDGCHNLSKVLVEIILIIFLVRGGIHWAAIGDHN